MSFESYERLSFERRDGGVLLLTIDRPEKYNAADAVMLNEFSTVWTEIAADEETRVVVVTGRGKAFSAGGDLNEEVDNVGDFHAIMRTFEEARALVATMIDCDKPIISAINGPAAGAGLVVGLMSDISIVGKNVKVTDGHVNIGIVAGDHAAVIWPLLCGMAKAKHILLTGDQVTGEEAERIGLVSKAVDDAEVLDEALALADRLAKKPKYALKFTKHSLNNWLRLAMPTFETSLAYEMLTFFSPDAKEGMTSFLEKRRPNFE